MSSEYLCAQTNTTHGLCTLSRKSSCACEPIHLISKISTILHVEVFHKTMCFKDLHNSSIRWFQDIPLSKISRHGNRGKKCDRVSGTVDRSIDRAFSIFDDIFTISFQTNKYRNDCVIYGWIRRQVPVAVGFDYGITQTALLSHEVPHKSSIQGEIIAAPSYNSVCN